MTGDATRTGTWSDALAQAEAIPTCGHPVREDDPELLGICSCGFYYDPAAVTQTAKITQLLSTRPRAIGLPAGRPSITVSAPSLSLFLLKHHAMPVLFHRSASFTGYSVRSITRESAARQNRGTRPVNLDRPTPLGISLTPSAVVMLPGYPARKSAELR